METLSKNEQIKKLAVLQTSLQNFAGRQEFEEKILNTNEVSEMARAGAEFWLKFVADPFGSANTELAKLYLNTQLAEKRIEIFTFDLIDRFQGSNDHHQDLRALTALFILSMRPAGALLRSL